MSRMHRYVRKVALPLVVGLAALIAVVAGTVESGYAEQEHASATSSIVASDTHWT